MHECGSLPSATDGNPRTQLPRRLAHSGPFRGIFDIAQYPLLQPLRLPWAQGQFYQEHTVTQSTSFVPGHSYRLSADDSDCLSRASHDDSAAHGFLRGRYRQSAQSFPQNAGPYGSGFAGTSVGTASHTTHPVATHATHPSNDPSWSRGFHPCNGDSGLCISPGPLKGPPLAKARCDLRQGA